MYKAVGSILAMVALMFGVTTLKPAHTAPESPFAVAQITHQERAHAQDRPAAAPAPEAVPLPRARPTAAPKRKRVASAEDFCTRVRTAHATWSHERQRNAYHRLTAEQQAAARACLGM